MAPFLSGLSWYLFLTKCIHGPISCRCIQWSNYRSSEPQQPRLPPHTTGNRNPAKAPTGRAVHVVLEPPWHREGKLSSRNADSEPQRQIKEHRS
jgi:hypothetical protein